MQRLAGVVTENPARFFAVLAGVAFVILLATLIAQVAVALVCEVGHFCNNSGPALSDWHYGALLSNCVLLVDGFWI